MKTFKFFRGESNYDVREEISLENQNNLFYNITLLPNHGSTRRWSFRLKGYLFLFNITGNRFADDEIEEKLLRSLSLMDNFFDDINSFNDLNNFISGVFQNYGNPTIQIIN